MAIHRYKKQSNYIKHARSFGQGARKQSKRTTSFSDSVAHVRLSRSKRHASNVKIYGRLIKYALLILMIIGWGSLPIFLPYFRISSVIYTGFSSNDLQKFAETQVAESLKNEKPWWPHNNFFIFNTDDLTQKLLAEPRVRTVEVRKNFPHALSVIVAEKSSHLVYFSEVRKNAILDEDGGFQQTFGPDSSAILTTTSLISSDSTLRTDSVTSTSFDNSSLSLPSLTLTEAQIKSIPLGLRALPRLIDYRTSLTGDKNSAYIPKDLARRVLEWSDALKASNFGAISVVGLDGDVSPFRLIFKTKQPWSIITDMSKDPTKQLGEISLLLKTQKPQRYVDMRFDGRIYWK